MQNGVEKEQAENCMGREGNPEHLNRVDHIFGGRVCLHLMLDVFEEFTSTPIILDAFGGKKITSLPALV